MKAPKPFLGESFLRFPPVFNWYNHVLRNCMGDGNAVTYSLKIIQFCGFIEFGGKKTQNSTFSPAWASAESENEVWLIWFSFFASWSIVQCHTPAFQCQGWGWRSHWFTGRRPLQPQCIASLRDIHYSYCSLLSGRWTANLIEVDHVPECTVTSAIPSKTHTSDAHASDSQTQRVAASAGLFETVHSFEWFVCWAPGMDFFL